ncbi:hypothetical protein BGZ73_000042 [Actinomortierella ambigua]|nr:hypothetical protein BGZ73_000042 [Actinomortierella ambigua]
MSTQQHDIADPMDSAEDDSRNTIQDHEENKDHCVICLHEWEDKSILEICQHAFCFKCLFQWAMVSRSCPLCVRPFESCIHLIVSDEEYTIHHFEPLETKRGSSSQPSNSNTDQNTFSSHGVIRQLYGPPQLRPRFPHERRRYYHRPPPPETPEERSVAEQQRNALQKRVHIYRHGLYVKHMGANRISRYQQITPETFQVFPARLDRLAPWVRRELQAIALLHRPGRISGASNGPSSSSSSTSPPSSLLGDDADENEILSDELAPGLEVVREYILALMKEYDLQTDRAMDLLRGFLLEYTEHFVHELMAYARSPFSIEAYDQTAQYSLAASTSQPSHVPHTTSSSRHSTPSRQTTTPSYRDGESDRRKRLRGDTDGGERVRNRHDRHGKSVKRRGSGDSGRKDIQDSSAEKGVKGDKYPRIPQDDGSSREQSSVIPPCSTSSEPQLVQKERMQRLIREKLAREQAIYDRNHSL